MTRGLRYSSTAVMPERLRAGRKSPARRDEEHEQQVVLFNRLAALAINEPRYAVPVRRTYAIPNGGGRSKREGGRLKAEGVRAGVSDIFVSVARAHWHGLYIEMKSRTGRVSPAQQAWMDDCVSEGYYAAVCRSADEAMALWCWYVDGCNGDRP